MPLPLEWNKKIFKVPPNQNQPGILRFCSFQAVADDVRRLKDEKPLSSHSIPSQPAPQGLLCAAGVWLLPAQQRDKAGTESMQNLHHELQLLPSTNTPVSMGCHSLQHPGRGCPGINPSSNTPKTSRERASAMLQELLTGTLSLHRLLLQELRGLDQA